MEGELFLPAIMTHFNAAERRKLYTKVKQHIVNGKYTGRYVPGRPTVRMVSRHKHHGERRVAIHVAHVVLVMHGKLPKEDEHASHLCHNSACVRIEHLVWESAGHNMRRMRCQARGACVCKLTPACLINCASP